MNSKVSETQAVLQQISDILLMNGGIFSSPGLYTGDMGLVLFFTRYARYTQNDLYLDYCYELMGKLPNKINRGTPISYKQGLTGIGSATEYLVQNGFFEADTDEILEDFDKQIFFTYNLPYLSINEIMDVGSYAMWRLSGNSSRKDMIRQDILPTLEKVVQEHSVMPIWRRQKKMPDSFIEKTFDHCLKHISNNAFWNKGLGLQNGLAGWGISLLTELDGDDSWLLLLPDN